MYGDRRTTRAASVVRCVLRSTYARTTATVHTRYASYSTREMRISRYAYTLNLIGFAFRSLGLSRYSGSGGSVHQH